MGAVKLPAWDPLAILCGLALAASAVSLGLSLGFFSGGDSAADALAKAFTPAGAILNLSDALVLRDAGTLVFPVFPSGPTGGPLSLVALYDLAGGGGPVGPAGEAGDTGAAGLAGPRGVNGTAGVAGAAGPRGPIGPAGANGSSVAGVAQLDDLVASLPPGDVAFDGNVLLVSANGADAVKVRVAAFARAPEAVAETLVLTTPDGPRDWSVTFYRELDDFACVVEFSALAFSSATMLLNVSLTATLPEKWWPGELQELPVTGRVTQDALDYMPGEIRITPTGELDISFWSYQYFGSEWLSPTEKFVFISQGSTYARGGVAAALDVEIPASYHFFRLASA